VAFLALPSLVGLLVQALVVLLIASLCLVLQRTVRRDPLLFWSAGWLALFCGLTALFFAFQFAAFQNVGQSMYLLGEYAFGYLLIAGCRRYVSGQSPAGRDGWLIVPGLFLAVFLPKLGGGDFNIFFIVHALIYAYLFLVAFRVLWSARSTHRGFTGFRVMHLAVLLLAIDYAHYVPLFGATYLGVLPSPLHYLQYSPLYDLILLVMLAFGMLMVMTGEVQHELQLANARLAETRDRLAELAKVDHLTSALNRHAFYSIIENPNSGDSATLRGCAAVADIDNMKSINDRYGHIAGDAAIRAVAGAIRSCIRADDLLFRWGGDEFLILLIGVSESEARARLDRLDVSLSPAHIPGLSEPVGVSVSVGYAPFESASSLDEVIALADMAMYGKKRAT
jgi:diguanylate cyclase (GGDEF)-like protein